MAEPSRGQDTTDIKTIDDATRWMAGQPIEKDEPEPSPEPDAETQEYVEPADWTDYVDYVQKDESGNITSIGKRKDMILVDLVEAGAPAETIAEFINKNPEAAQAIGTQHIVEGVNRALETGESVKVATKTASPDTITETEISSAGIGVQGRQLNRDQYDHLMNLSGQQQYDYAVELGIIPEGSIYVPGTEMGYITTEQALKLKEQDEYLYQVYVTEGYEAYKQALESRQESLEGISKRQFENKLAEFNQWQDPESGGYFLGNALYDRLQAGEDYEDILEDITSVFGAGGATRAIGEMRKIESSVSMQGYYQKEYDTQQAALAQLSGYKDPEGDGYFIQKYIADNPTEQGLNTILTAGFQDKELLEQAKEYIAGVKQGINDIDNLMSPSTPLNLAGNLALVRAIDNAGLSPSEFFKYFRAGQGEPLIPKDVITRTWESLTPEQKAQVAAQYVSDNFKGNYFAEVTAMMSQGASELGRFGELITAPISGITVPIAKATTGQPVSAMEWAGVGVTAALDLLIIAGGGFGVSQLGRIATYGVKGAATAYIGTSLGMNWDKYDNTDKAIAFAMMGLLWAGEAYTGARNIVKGGKPRATIDTSIQASGKEVLAELRKTTPKLVKPFREVIRSQRDYARDMAGVERIRNKIHNIDINLKGEHSPTVTDMLEATKFNLEGQLEKAITRMALSESRMMKIAGRYSQVSSKLATDPVVAASMKTLPQYLKRATYELVDNVMNPRKVSDIKWDLKQAKTELQKLVNENPNNPAAWRESALKVVTYGRELSMVRAGGVNKLYYQLVKMQEQYTRIIQQLETSRSPSIRALLEKSARELEYKMAQVKADIQNSIYEMELILGDDTTAINRATWQTDELIDTIVRQRGKTGAKGVKFDMPEVAQKRLLLAMRGELPKGGRPGLPEGETPPSVDIEGSIKANEGFIKIVDDFLKNKSVKNQSRLDTILKTQQEAKRQVKVAVKEKTQPIVEGIRVAKPGEFLPARVSKTTTKVTTRTGRTPRTATPVPVREPAPSIIEISTKTDVYRRLWGSPATYTPRQRELQRERQGSMTPEQARRLREQESPVEAVSPYTITSPREKPSEYPQPYPEVQAQPEPFPEPAPATAPAPEPEPAPSPFPYPEPYPEPYPQPEPAPVPPPTPPPTPPAEVDTPITPVLSRTMAASPPGVLIPEGSIAFAWGQMYQGSGKSRVKRPVWKYITPEDFRNGIKPKTIYGPPHGAINIESFSPYATIQVIGRSRTGKNVPASITIDMGVTDALISNYGTKISFTGTGEITDAGTRDPSPTSGMDVLSEDYWPTEYDNLRGKSRVKFSKKKPTRKGRDNTPPSIGGIRY